MKPYLSYLFVGQDNLPQSKAAFPVLDTFITLKSEGSTQLNSINRVFHRSPSKAMAHEAYGQHLPGQGHARHRQVAGPQASAQRQGGGKQQYQGACLVKMIISRGIHCIIIQHTKKCVWIMMIRGMNYPTLGIQRSCIYQFHSIPWNCGFCWFLFL